MKDLVWNKNFILLESTISQQAWCKQNLELLCRHLAKKNLGVKKKFQNGVFHTVIVYKNWIQNFFKNLLQTKNWPFCVEQNTQKINQFLAAGLGGVGINSPNYLLYGK